MTRPHLEFFGLFPSNQSGRTRAFDRLLKMSSEEVGIIKRLEQKSYYSQGRPHFVYVPTKETVVAIAEKKRIHIDDVPWNGRELQRGNFQLPHILDTAWLYVTFTKVCKERGYSMQWLNTLMLRRKRMIEQVEVVGPRGAKRTVKIEPDALCIIDTNERPNTFYIEVERTRDDRQEVADKMTAYLYFFDRSGQKGRVLYIALTHDKMLKLKKICENCHGRNRFWFAVLSDLLQNDPFTDVWMKAGSEGTFPLIF
jgi:hypothetical protein